MPKATSNLFSVIR